MNLTRIELYGHLRKRFGRRFYLAVGSPAEAIRALCVQVKGFREYLTVHSEPGYRVLVGADAQKLDQLGNPVSSAEVIKLVPVVAGAKDGLGQILFGAALVAVGVGMWMLPGAGWATGDLLINMGVAMMIGGAASLLATPPSLSGAGQHDTGPADSPSYTFGSPTVTIGQGRPVPVLYGGPLRVGGAVVSAGIASEGYQKGGFGGAAPDDAGTRGGDGDLNPWVWSIEPGV